MIASISNSNDYSHYGGDNVGNTTSRIVRRLKTHNSLEKRLNYINYKSFSLKLFVSLTCLDPIDVLINENRPSAVFVIFVISGTVHRYIYAEIKE